MACSTLKHHRSSFSPSNQFDRISQLPKALISSILSNLPTKDAVKTSILSRSWMSRWSFVTNFHFDENSSKKFINMVLDKHSGNSINKFILQWEHYPSLYLKKWVNIAIARNVCVLDLRSDPSNSSKLNLPSSIYTSRNLEVLKLEGRFRVNPPNVMSLPKLVEMELKEVIYKSDKSICSLISGCPVLYSLKIVRTNGGDHMKVCCISSLVLRYLIIDFNLTEEEQSNFSELKLEIDAPMLEFLILDDYKSSNITIQPQHNSINKVRIDAIHLDQNAIVELVRALGNVKFLNLQVPYMMMPPRWSRFIDMLDSCTKLNELEIYYYACVPFEDALRIFDRGAPRCMLSSLRRLKIARFCGREEEIELLKFFLDYSQVLETVNICCDLQDYKRSEILSKVCELSRSSPNCRIHCL